MLFFFIRQFRCLLGGLPSERMRQPFQMPKASADGHKNYGSDAEYEQQGKPTRLIEKLLFNKNGGGAGFIDHPVIVGCPDFERIRAGIEIRIGNFPSRTAGVPSIVISFQFIFKANPLRNGKT